MEVRRVKDLNLSKISGDSTDQEILEAIDRAGDLRCMKRLFDWPRAGETKAWVPLQVLVGSTKRKDIELEGRLEVLVHRGCIEKTTKNRLNGMVKDMSHTGPRFRVKLKK